MIKHIVMWKLKDEAEGNSKAENAKIIKNSIEDLKENINKPILIYCKVGNKSALACQMLEEEGFVNLYNLGQGILGYEGKLV